jgi:hypothetical protein
VFLLWHIMKNLSLTPSIKVAIGCRVMITNNIHLAKGVVNGATGIVEGLLLRESDPSEIMTVLVRLDGTNELVRVTRTKFARFYRGSDFFLKRTFPMRLAYGITGELKAFQFLNQCLSYCEENFFGPLLMHLCRYCHIRSQKPRGNTDRKNHRLDEGGFCSRVGNL